jgi:teichuronic acid exporter
MASPTCKVGRPEDTTERYASRLPMYLAPSDEFQPHQMQELTPTSSAPGASPVATLGPLPPSPPPEKPADAVDATLARSFVRGVAWTALVKLIGQATAWVSTIVVARLLSPEDYGIVGMATLYLGLLQTVSEFGIGTAVVTRRELPMELAQQLNTVSVLLGIVGTAIIAITAPLVGAFYGNPRLPLVLAAMGLTFLITSARTVPWALLRRDLRFKRLAAYDGVQSVALAVASVALAAGGFRYWTLVCAAILSASLSTAIAVIQHPVRFARPDFRRLREVLTFGSNVVVQRLAWYGYSNADFLVAGRMLGSAQLGAYTLAYELAQTPGRKIGALIFQLTPSMLGRLQTERGALRRFFLRVSEAVLLVICPLCVGLALVAPEFVPLILGNQWTSMVAPLQVLAVYAGLSVLLVLPSQILLVTGHERFGTRYAIGQLMVMPLAFVIGSRWGIAGIALAWPLVHPFVASFLLRKVLHALELPFRVFFRAVLWPPISSAVVMAVAVWGVRRLADDGFPPIALLATEILAGAAAYGGALLILHRSRMRESWESLRGLRQGAGP